MGNTNNKYDKSTQDIFFNQIKAHSRKHNSIIDYPHRCHRDNSCVKSVGDNPTPADIYNKNQELLIIFEDCGVDLIE